MIKFSNPKWLVAIGLATLVALLWLPSGFDVGFWADDWNVYSFIEQGIVFLFDSNRILAHIPGAVAYWFTPDQFLGMNLVAMAALLGRGVLCYAILRRLGTLRVVAFAASALAVVYPADQATFYLGALGIHVALCSYLLGVWGLIVWWQSRRWMLLPLIWGALLVATGLHEVVFPLIVCTPLLIIALERRLSRQLMLATAIWYLVPLVAGGRGLWLFLQHSSSVSYQQSLINASSFANVFGNVVLAYRRHFLDGWTSGLDTGGTNHLLVASIAGLVVGGICWLLARGQSPVITRKTIYFYCALGLGGFVAIGLGFAAYSVTSLGADAYRTYYFSAPGAGLAVVIAVLLVTVLLLRSWHAFSVIIGLLALVAMIRLLNQHEAYALWSRNEITILAGIVQHVPGVPQNTGIIVLDEAEGKPLRTIFAGTSLYVHFPLKIIYHDPTLDAALCYPDESNPWGPISEQCRFGSTGVTLSSTSAIQWSRSYDRILILKYGANGHIEIVRDLSPYIKESGAQAAYNPDKLLNDDRLLPLRACTMLRMEGCR